MTMRKIFLTALGAASLFSVPASAQQTDRVLVLYGNDKCPTNSSGQEIVVCNRRPEAERYRIPKELRGATEIAPQNQSWAARAESIDQLGRSGTGSCSASGPGGWTGCWAQQMKQAKAERRAAAAADGREP